MTPEELKKPVTATEMGELQALINDINSVHFMKVLRRILWELEESRKNESDSSHFDKLLKLRKDLAEERLRGKEK